MAAFLSSPYSTIFLVIFYSLHSSFCPLARKLGLQLLCFATHFCDCIHVYSKQKEQEWGGEREMATTLVQWYFGFSSSSPIYLTIHFSKSSNSFSVHSVQTLQLYSVGETVWSVFTPSTGTFKSWFNQNSDNRFQLSYIPTTFCFINLSLLVHLHQQHTLWSKKT